MPRTYRTVNRPAQVHWKGRSGVFRRDVGHGEHAEIALAERIHRVRLSELG